MLNPKAEILAVICVLQLSLGLVASEAQAAEGILGESSDGSVYVTLRIGANDVEQLSAAVTSELRSTNSTSFPICISYVDSLYVSINVTDLNQQGMTLTSADGTEIPYVISLGTESSAGSEETKVKANSDSTCAAGSEFSVNVTLLPTADQADLTGINGTFSFLVKSE